MAIASRSAGAIAGQKLGDADFLDEVASEFQIQRRECNGGVADHLDGRSARSEQDRRAEDRIVGHPDDQLVCTQPPDHVLDREALNARIGA
jgi:hypothetical protein